jgi:transcriptional regulator with XRE-family HTH domain
MASRPQTEFGDYLDSLLKARGLTVRQFAKLIGVQSGVVSTAKRLTLNAVRIEQWSAILKLKGAERDRFVQLAWLAHCPEFVQALVDKLEQENRRLRERLNIDNN